MLEERKRELQQQQRANETEHLLILKTIADHDTVEFKQKVLQERHGFEKALLQEVGRTLSAPVSVLLLLAVVCTTSVMLLLSLQF